MEDFLLRDYFGNTVEEYLFAFGIFIGGVVLLKLFSFVVVRRLHYLVKKTKNTFDDFLLTFISKTAMPVLYLAAFYFSVRHLHLHGSNSRYLDVGYVIVFTVLVVNGFLLLIHYLLVEYVTRNEGENAELRKKQLSGFTTLVDLLVWTVSLIFLIGNLGFNVGALVATLGVSGIAIAIAAQAILGDFFAYFVIFFDRPFNVGDYIELDKDVGVVEYIGFKSTRLRTPTGDQLIVSNKDLTNARMHNYKKLERRRVVFKLGVTYQTTPEQLEAIPKIVKEIIQTVDNATFDRAHFVKFSDFSLDFELVYYCEDPDYMIHMNALQAVHLKIYKTFVEQGIQFAYPTQSVYIQK